MIHMKSEYEVKSGIDVTVFINTVCIRGVKETFRFLKYHPIQSPNCSVLRICHSACGALKLGYLGSYESLCV